jgi:hypothetical protein
VVTQVLAGLGGVGKSQLAAAYAAERADEVDLLAWVDARSRDAVVTGYAQAAARLGYRQVGEADQPDGSWAGCRPPRIAGGWWCWTT